MPILERNIENRCVKYARKHGWLARKMNGLGYVSWCDRLFIPPKKTGGGFVLWVEFKVPGKQLTALQQHHHKDMLAREQYIHVVWTFEDFVTLLKSYE